jgi:ribulose-bisphosphate carboxylase large chain
VNQTASLTLSGTRFTVTYTLSGTEQDCRTKAGDICYEQTVEFPKDLTPAGDLRDHIVGRIEDFRETGSSRFQTDISFAAETAGSVKKGSQLTQLLNVIFGNISLKPGIKVEKVDLPAEILSPFKGPRFGRAGLRGLLKVKNRPLICTALKPMGLSPRELAGQAYLFARGGIDIIKDDHGLADQPFCAFEERAARCAAAVHKANAETGKHSVYAPNITASAALIPEKAVFAKNKGAGALLISPGLTGPDSLRLLAEDDFCALPLISHPAFWGSFVTSPQSGLSPYFLYGQLMRLTGADAVIYPHRGGRFSFTQKVCEDIARGCSDKLGRLKTIFPMPGGGMTKDRLCEMSAMYGRDFILLIGGELHRHGKDLAEASRIFVEMLEKAHS